MLASAAPLGLTYFPSLPTLPASHALPPQHAKTARVGGPGALAFRVG